MPAPSLQMQQEPINMHRTCPELEVSGVTTGNGPPAAIMKRLVLGTSRLEMGAGGCVSANSAASSTTSAATHPSLQLTLCPHHSRYASSHTETRQVASPLATTSMMPFFFAASASEETFQAQARLFRGDSRATFMGRPCKIIGSATGRAATRGSR